MTTKTEYQAVSTTINRTATHPNGVFSASWKTVWQYLCNLALASCYMVFAVEMTIDYVLTHRVSSLLVTLFETIIVFYSLCRPAPKQRNSSVYDWAVGLGGTFILLLLRPAPQLHDYIALLAMQFLGVSISLFGLLSLNRSWGLVAANRGVKTGGLYAFVRHPIYAGYFLSFGAFVLQNLTIYNLLIYCVFVTLELLRVKAEERVLSRDPDYVCYARRTRWRVVPFVY
jgi:protein-S-isoprenylcysteine O-methyltransferase Ste14